MSDSCHGNRAGGCRGHVLASVLSATWQRCRVHTIRTQLRIGSVRAVTAGLAGGYWDDMANLQAAFADDDALDDELQDRLLVGKGRLVEAGTHARAVLSALVPEALRCMRGQDRSGRCHDIHRNASAFGKADAAGGGGDDLVVTTARTEEIAQFTVLAAEAPG